MMDAWPTSKTISNLLHHTTQTQEQAAWGGSGGTRSSRPATLVRVGGAQRSARRTPSMIWPLLVWTRTRNDVRMVLGMGTGKGGIGKEDGGVGGWWVAWLVQENSPLQSCRSIRSMTPFHQPSTSIITRQLMSSSTYSTCLLSCLLSLFYLFLWYPISCTQSTPTPKQPPLHPPTHPPTHPPL